jgi:hypothetical protein
MYGRRAKDDLTQAQLDEARRGFFRLLRSRFSPQYVEEHGEELFAIAALEYRRKLAEGSEIDRPVGWLIKCAWRRTGGHPRSPEAIP